MIFVNRLVVNSAPAFQAPTRESSADFRAADLFQIYPFFEIQYIRL